MKGKRGARVLISLIVTLLFLAVVPLTVFAVPQTINYQGYLTEPDGTPIDGTVEVVFSIYNVDSDGDVLWTETRTVTVTEGVFSVNLGDVEDIILPFDVQYYLGVEVEEDGEMTPRQPLTSVGYAFRAQEADSMPDEAVTTIVIADSAVTTAKIENDAITGDKIAPDAVTSANIANGSVGSTQIADNSVGAGDLQDGIVLAEILANDGADSNLDADLLDGMDSSAFVLTGEDFGRSGVSSTLYEGTTSLTDKYVNATGDTMSGSTASPVLSVTNTGTGHGVYGEATNDGAVTNYGGYFKANGTFGMGVCASASGTSGRGVCGEAYNYNATLNYGGKFKANGSSGIGVYGWATGTSGSGVYGYATGISGSGVYGSGRAYDFYAGGTGTNYGPFTGGHEVKFIDDFPGDVIPGMIVSVTGETQVRQREDGSISLSSTLPTVRLSNAANDKAVFGAVVREAPLFEDHWYKAKGEARFGIVNALGEGRVWVSNINGRIETGDYITTSPISGYGQRQDDDLLHSYTLGKAIETVDWDSVTETVESNGKTFKVYLIAVVYTSG